MSWAQGEPVGPEFRVNTYTTFPQHVPAIASDSTGNFVIVWQGFGQDGSSMGIFGQRYANTGARLGGEFQVNTYTTDYQYFPSVASDSAGNFVVAWHSIGQDGSGRGVFAQRYASTGAPSGVEFRVNTFTTGEQAHPSTACDSAGNFVIAWESAGQPGNQVFAQRYSSTGAPLGGEFRVNTSTTNVHSSVSVASDPAGNLIFAWDSLGQDGNGSGIFAQRYSSTGAPLGGEFRVNSYTPYQQQDPAVASDSAGGFVVTWISYLEDGSSSGIYAQRYANGGSPAGPEFRVNSYTTDFQINASVASDSAGNFVVVWQSFDQDGSSVGVFAQRYADTGESLGSEFRVNSYTTSYQGLPSVASDPTGHFVVTWSSTGEDGDSLGIFGQRYNMIVPVELMHLGVE